jgi:hypothetical protein
MTKNITFIAVDGTVWNTRPECKTYERLLTNAKHDYEALSNDLCEAALCECEILNILNPDFFEKNRSFVYETFSIDFDEIDLVCGLYRKDEQTNKFYKVMG